VNSDNPRETLLRAVAGELRVGRLARRRIIAELADHIDDAVDDLCGSGVPREEATLEAVRRLGDAETIADTFAVTHTRAAARSLLRVRRSLAWMMVAAMSGVTAVAAELPQASGAKPPAKVLIVGAGPTASRVAPTDRAATRFRIPTVAAAGHGRPADRR